MLLKFVPFLFLFLWASGFVGARLDLQYAEPATLLSLRMLANLGLFILMLWLLRQRMPTGRLLLHCVVAGLLAQGLFLGGTYLAIAGGMPSGLCSLLVGVQPILTAVILLGSGEQRFSATQWLGLALGFVGIALVLQGKMAWQHDGDRWLAYGFAILALLGITLGTLYQKRHCQGVSMLGNLVAQNLGAGLLFLPVAALFETGTVNWTTEFLLVMGWLVVVLSLLATQLLIFMISQGKASSVATVFYLVPPITALQAWVLFGETMAPAGLFGFLLSALAVYLVVRPEPD